MKRRMTFCLNLAGLKLIWSSIHCMVSQFCTFESLCAHTRWIRIGLGCISYTSTCIYAIVIIMTICYIKHTLHELIFIHSLLINTCGTHKHMTPIVLTLTRFSYHYSIFLLLTCGSPLGCWSRQICLLHVCISGVPPVWSFQWQCASDI